MLNLIILFLEVVIFCVFRFMVICVFVFFLVLVIRMLICFCGRIIGKMLFLK